MKRKIRYTSRGAVLLSLILLSACLAGCGGKLAEQVTYAEGNTIQVGELILTVEASGFRDSVEPENPEGYFDYYEEHEGYRYYVMSGKAENTSGEEIRASAFRTEGTTDAGEADAKLLFLDEGNTRFPDVIGAGSEELFLLIMLVKDNEQPEEFCIGYNEGYKTPQDGESCDYGVIKQAENE